MNDIEIDKFLESKEKDTMRKFEFVERIKEVAMEITEGAYCKLPEGERTGGFGSTGK